jgi:hypothetical protein
VYQYTLDFGCTVEFAIKLTYKITPKTFFD